MDALFFARSEGNGSWNKVAQMFASLSERNRIRADQGGSGGGSCPKDTS